MIPSCPPSSLITRISRARILSLIRTNRSAIGISSRPCWPSRGAWPCVPTPENSCVGRGGAHGHASRNILRRAPSLPFRGSGVDKLPNPAGKIVQGAEAGISGVPAPHGDAASLGFAIADYQHERHLLKLRIANARIQFLVAVV